MEDTVSLPSDTVVSNIIVYIAGYVVRKALKMVKCAECQDVLSTAATEPRLDRADVLFQHRQYGGLIMPSDGVIKILKVAESHIRGMSELNRATSQCTSKKLQARVLHQLGNQPLFDIDIHFRETQVGIDNHFFDLLRIVVHIYYELRQHHIVRLHNMGQKNKAVRHKLTKTILFMGQ